jgi:tRNA-specific adenosine deaminase 3
MSKELFLIVGSTNAITQQALIEGLSSLMHTVSISSIPVPLLAPTSQEQAAFWSSQYWPTVYKKSNPFGPHPSIVSRAEEQIRGDVEKFMALATEVAETSRVTGIGEAVGVVIVERGNGTARPVALAGDARWLDWPRVGSGNVTAHPVLRATAMIAESLKAKDEMQQRKEGDHGFNTDTNAEELTIFHDQPLGAVEQENYGPSSSGDGYLCHELEIYCTHEPCVMCSMAIVHSRFGRVIFQNRMSSTGGLCADGHIGHGLFWRKELNWTLLAWHWDCANDNSTIDFRPGFNA